MKKYLISFLVIAIFSITAVSANTIFERKTALVREDYSIRVNGEQVEFKNSIVTIDNITYIAVREASTVLGSKVDFNKGVIEITQNEIEVNVPVEQDEIAVVSPVIPEVSPERIKQMIESLEHRISLNDNEYRVLNENVKKFRDLGRDDLADQLLESIEVNKNEKILLEAELAELQK